MSPPKPQETEGLNRTRPPSDSHAMRRKAWIVYLLIGAVATLGFAFAASTERGDEMILTMLYRGCRAIRELETLDLIRAYSAI